MQLYGSTTSPYVRRLRLYLANQPYEFINMDIFSAEGRKLLKANNPAMKIPMLKDDEQVIYDSRVIQRYLDHKNGQPQPDWQQENTLTLIDAANDSLVELLLLHRSGVERNSDLMFAKLQRDRVGVVLKALNAKVLQGQFDEWHYNSISLYCLVDWIVFRDLFDLSKFEHLLDFKNRHQDRADVKQTDPRD